jgi:signal transduction histidine kinase
MQPALVHVAMLSNYNLLVGRYNTLFAPLQTRFWYGLAAAIAVLSVAGLLVGLITRRALMSRINSIRQTVSAIMHGDLKHRLPTHLNDDELNTLSRTINGMLEQIELLVHGVRNVSNSIAHDLRTPLAELRSRLEELALIRPPPAETFAEVDGAVADVDRVIRIFDALLRLAEIDAGLRRSGFVPLDLADLASNAVEFYAPLRAEGHRAHAAFRRRAIRGGDPVLLRGLGQPVGQRLEVCPGEWNDQGCRAQRVDGTVEVSVADNGPGIAESERIKVVERFYRGDASRGTPGVGLGLSLAQAVATARQRARILGSSPGLRVAFTVPLDAAAVALRAAGAAVRRGRSLHRQHWPPPSRNVISADAHQLRRVPDGRKLGDIDVGQISDYLQRPIVCGSRCTMPPRRNQRHAAGVLLAPPRG